jgi:DNA-binding LacI/PurR family transcriptional regulator
MDPTEKLNEVSDPTQPEERASMPAKKRRVTIQDVANYAGVSIGAVSKVLHGKGSTIRVSALKAEQIRQAALVLNYVSAPHRAAHTRRTGLIALLTGDPLSLVEEGLTDTLLLDRLLNAATKRGYSLAICSSLPSGNPRDLFDGIIYLPGALASNSGKTITELGLPSVVINASITDCPGNVVKVQFDLREAVGLALHRLKELKHKSICLAGFEDLSDEVIAGGILGFAHDAAQAHGMTTTITRCDDLAKEMKKLPYTAMIAGTDRVAAKVVRLRESTGIRIPEDLSLISIGGSPFNQWVAPRICSVRVPTEAIAERAMEGLVSMINGEPIAERPAPVHCTLDVRETTRCLSA